TSHSHPSREPTPPHTTTHPLHDALPISAIHTNPKSRRHASQHPHQRDSHRSIHTPHAETRPSPPHTAPPNRPAPANQNTLSSTSSSYCQSPSFHPGPSDP